VSERRRETRCDGRLSKPVVKQRSSANSTIYDYSCVGRCCRTDAGIFFVADWCWLIIWSVYALHAITVIL
jgi:hypothetical protein